MLLSSLNDLLAAAGRLRTGVALELVAARVRDYDRLRRARTYYACGTAELLRLTPTRKPVLKVRLRATLCTAEREVPRAGLKSSWTTLLTT